jgi:hypothetical protein
MPKQGARLSWPRPPFLVCLALAIAALVLRYTVLDTASSAASQPVLSGVTTQGTSFDIGLSGRRIRWLRTSLAARCTDGSPWKASWSPTDGIDIHIATSGRSFTTYQRAATKYTGGVVGRIGFALAGSWDGHGGAQGTVRLVARFYRGERQSGACDSLDVVWAAGPNAKSSLDRVAPGRQIGEYYPAVPSLAIDVSPQRRRFIARVDGVCTATYTAGARAQAQADRLYGYFDRRALLESAYYVSWHAWQLRSLLALGQPPQARAPYDAWLANFRERLRLEREGLRLYERNDQAGIRRTMRELYALKAEGNLAGQRFGLVRCTSNGDRSPVPVLSDGQPLPLN